MQKTLWTELCKEKITKNAISQKWKKSDGYYLSFNTYDPGEQFSGRLSAPTIILIMEGSCIYNLDGQIFFLTDEEVIQTGPCNYYFQAPEDRFVTVAKIYKIPKKYLTDSN